MYSIVKYKHLISNQDADTQKRYGMIEKLSNGFTTENTTALALDKLLTEQIELETESEVLVEEPAIKKVSRSKSKNGSDDVEMAFTNLFEALKQHTIPALNVNNDSLRDAIAETLKRVKIRLSDLDEDLQKRVSSSPVLIKYDFPKTKTAPFKKPEIADFQRVVDDVMLGNNVFLVGGAGTGKTYLAENLIAKMALGRQYITINCSQWTAPVEIIGGQTMDGFTEGKLIEAWSKGYVLILDELPKIDPNTAGLLNDALAKTKVSGAIIFNARKESFPKHEDFACIATGNIYPDKESITYGANNKQDLSLLDRFSGSVYFISKNPVIERDILHNDMVWSICDKIRSVIDELKYEAQLSLRFMQNARDAYNLEMLRIKDKGKDGVQANDGKTLKSAVDSYISTFTEVQQKNIKDKIRYNELFGHYEYRDFPTSKMVF
ncbi:AAA family ATPase [Chitinophaga sp. Hz27]|uniref:AAA family ATPase n=1 Tax=Chitinophaga sp. Hz27 TaxID=3347169 RepID=UPI0035DFC27C